jgi:hypothetical protein
MLLTRILGNPRRHCITSYAFRHWKVTTIWGPQKRRYFEYHEITSAKSIKKALKEHSHGTIPIEFP